MEAFPNENRQVPARSLIHGAASLHSSDSVRGAVGPPEIDSESATGLWRDRAASSAAETSVEALLAAQNALAMRELSIRRTYIAGLTYRISH
jgi:hypothetical protein